MLQKSPIDLLYLISKMLFTDQAKAFVPIPACFEYPCPSKEKKVFLCRILAELPASKCRGWFISRRRLPSSMEIGDDSIQLGGCFGYVSVRKTVLKTVLSKRIWVRYGRACMAKPIELCLNPHTYLLDTEACDIGALTTQYSRVELVVACSMPLSVYGHDVAVLTLCCTLRDLHVSRC